jgi:hypothetical protein
MDAVRLHDGTTSLRDTENWQALGSAALLPLIDASRRSLGGAILAATSAPLLYRGEPAQTVRENLRHFKQLLEAGATPRTTAAA